MMLSCICNLCWSGADCHPFHSKCTFFFLPLRIWLLSSNQFLETNPFIWAMFLKWRNVKTWFASPGKTLEPASAQFLHLSWMAYQKKSVSHTPNNEYQNTRLPSRHVEHNEMFALVLSSWYCAAPFTALWQSLTDCLWVIQGSLAIFRRKLFSFWLEGMPSVFHLALTFTHTHKHTRIDPIGSPSFSCCTHSLENQYRHIISPLHGSTPSATHNRGPNTCRRSVSAPQMWYRDLHACVYGLWDFASGMSLADWP